MGSSVGHELNCLEHWQLNCLRILVGCAKIFENRSSEFRSRDLLRQPSFDGVARTNPLSSGLEV